MKKMIDLFYLPVSSNGDYLMDNQKNVVAKFECPEQAAHVANAVVCINDLAEALEAIVSDYNQYRAVNGIDLTDDHSAKLDVKMATAEAALNAYRGVL